VVTVVIFDVGGRAVTALLDALAESEPPRQVDRMTRLVRRILQTIRFSDE
jgi:hypothetical protein